MIEKLQIISNVFLIISELFVVLWVVKIMVKVTNNEKMINEYKSIIDNCQQKIKEIEWIVEKKF